MSVRMLFPKNRLGELLRKPGGLKVSEAMEQANANLATLRGACLDDLTAVVEDMEQRFTAFPGAFDDAAVTDFYTAAGRSVGVAGACGIGAVDAALTSLCVLLDNLRLRRQWDAEAVQVHVKSLRVLVSLAKAGQDSGLDQILDGLTRVSARYAVAS